MMMNRDEVTGYETALEDVLEEIRQRKISRAQADMQEEENELLNLEYFIRKLKEGSLEG